MRRLLRSAPPARPDEGGFTLVEMSISMALMAVIALALAGVLHSGLRALGAAKARAQGNDVATQGIEDLQRFDFNNLGLCGDYSPAPHTPPAGLSDRVGLNCPSTLPSYDCNTAVGGSVALAQYTCRRNNIDYTVRRYVAWVDPLHTTKRLAVYVDWDDLTGRHQVSQQSSLRAPDQAAILGLAPPAFSTATPPAASTSPSPVVLASDGTLPSGSSITLNATTQNLHGTTSTTYGSGIPTPRSAGDRFTISVGSATGFPGYNGYPVKIAGEAFTVLAGAGTTSWLVAAEATSSTTISTGSTVVFEGDRVYGNFETVDPATGDVQTSTAFLTSTNGTSWSGVVDSSAGFAFSPGRQYVSFGILRAADGKASAAFSSTPIRFCPAADPTCINLKDPIVNAPPDQAVALDPSGALVAPLTITTTTHYINSGDAVTVSFGTSAGVVSVAMAEDPAAPCLAAGSVRTNAQCGWKVTIRPEDGHRFTPGAQPFYIKARQLIPDTDPATVDYLSTGAAVAKVTFS